MSLIDKINSGIGKGTHIIILSGTIIAAVSALIVILNSMQTGKKEVEEIDKLFNIKEINENIQKGIVEKQEKQRIDFSNPLCANYDGDNLVINCSTFLYKDIGIGQIDGSFSGASPAEYRFSVTKPGIIVLGNIENTIKEFLEKDKDMKIRIIATGYSDGLNVKIGTKYDGKLGNDISVTYRNIVNPAQKETKRFIINQTPMENLDYAKLRAYDIINYLQPRFDIDDDNIEIYVEQRKEIGPEYRGCDFSITLENVLLLRNEEFKKLGWGARQFIIP